MKIDNSIREVPLSGLNVKKLVRDTGYEVIVIGLSKSTLLPPHISKEDAHLILLEGSIEFRINGKSFSLTQNQAIHFSKDTEHAVLALENAKFLIIR